jgi:hypothetical protein
MKATFLLQISSSINIVLMSYLSNVNLQINNKLECSWGSSNCSYDQLLVRQKPLNFLQLEMLHITVFTHRILACAYYLHPNFSSIFRGLTHIARPSILNLGMVTDSYCRSHRSVTSFVLQECGISAVLVRTLGLYYNAETLHFKFMNRIPNSGPNLKVTSKISPSMNSSHNFHTPIT